MRPMRTLAAAACQVTFEMADVDAAETDRPQ